MTNTRVCKNRSKDLPPPLSGRECGHLISIEKPRKEPVVCHGRLARKRWNDVVACIAVLFDSAYVIALSAWVGSILFFSFGVAPVIFSALGEAAGGKFVRALFPRYYLWGAIAGAIALPAFVAGPLCYHEFRGPMVGVQALVILACTLCMLYGGNSLTPAINQARDAGPAGHDQFNRLHRRAVRLNGLVLLAGIGLLIAFAVRPAPRTSGIVELTPAEQARFDSGVNRVIQDVEAQLRPSSAP